MEVPRPHLTVRQIMAVAALTAFILGAEEVRWRWSHFRRRAAEAEQGASLIREGAWGYRLVADESRGERRLVDSPDALLWLSYYEGLRRKYERAASRPWLSVAPDPPPPTDWVPTPPAR